MVTGSVMTGSGVAGVMVFTAPFSGVMAKRMKSSPAVALAFEIAARKEPTPTSLVLMTVKVSACAGPTRLINAETIRMGSRFGFMIRLSLDRRGLDLRTGHRV